MALTPGLALRLGRAFALVARQPATALFTRTLDRILFMARHVHSPLTFRDRVSCQHEELATAMRPERMSVDSYNRTRLVTCAIKSRVSLGRWKRSAALIYRRLGDSKLTVSEIAFGSWLTFSDGPQKANAIACVHRALERGITLIDTANVYGHGAAERVLGEALAGINRDSYVLATKLYFPMSGTDRGLSREQILKQLDASLARLRVSHVDLYQCHRYDTDTPLEETMQALSEVVRAGKVRYIGFSEWPVDRVEAARAIPNVERFVSSQPQYSLLHRDPERAVIPLSMRSGISQIVWSPLAQGVLTGKYAPGGDLPRDSRAADAAMGGSLDPAWLRPAVLEAVRALKPLAAEAGLTLAQFALAWVLRQPNVASAITGASRPDQVDENAAASGTAVASELFERAERIISGVATGPRRSG